MYEYTRRELGSLSDTRKNKTLYRWSVDLGLKMYWASQVIFQAGSSIKQWYNQAKKQLDLCRYLTKPTRILSKSIFYLIFKTRNFLLSACQRSKPIGGQPGSEKGLKSWKAVWLLTSTWKSNLQANHKPKKINSDTKELIYHSMKRGERRGSRHTSLASHKPLQANCNKPVCCNQKQLKPQQASEKFQSNDNDLSSCSICGDSRYRLGLTVPPVGINVKTAWSMVISSKCFKSSN